MACVTESTAMVGLFPRFSLYGDTVAWCLIRFRIGCMATSKQRPSGSSVALEPERLRLQPPPLYKVVLLNDDYTPMDFVVVVLEKFFGMNREQATVVMLNVHRKGRGVCGVFPRDLAATKVEQVCAFARRHQHPLACVMEEN